MTTTTTKTITTTVTTINATAEKRGNVEILLTTSFAFYNEINFIT